MAYAWYPEPHRLELRYTASPAGAAPFAIWRCDASEPVPSLAGISPLLSWYEREITDLFGLRFLDHPQPHRLVLHDGAQSSKPPFDPDYPPRTPAARASRRSKRSRTSPAPRPTCNCCRSARYAPTWSNPASFFSITSAKRSCIIIRGCSSSIAVWKSGSRASMPRAESYLAERVSGVGSVAHALAFCQAVEAASNCIVPTRAKVLRVLLAEMERLYNHLHYFGHLCHTTTLKVGEAEGKLLEERAKQLNTRLTGSRFLRSVLGLGGLRRDLTPKPWLGRRARNAARRLRKLCSAHGKYRQPSRPADHHRAARPPPGIRSGRDRTDRACLGRRPRCAARSSICRLWRASAHGRDARGRRRPCARAGTHGGGECQHRFDPARTRLCCPTGRCARTARSSPTARAWVGPSRRAARCSTRCISAATASLRASKSNRRRSRTGACFRSPCTTAT